MKRYKFAPMLGPAHGKPVGSSSQRAECWGNELECHVSLASVRLTTGRVDYPDAR